MKAAESVQFRTATLSEETAVFFVEVFYRIFKIGIYYPLGHVLLDQAASKFVQQLRETFPACPIITLEIKKDQLILEGKVLLHDALPVRDLHELLVSFGIDSIIIQRTLSHKQLLKFVRSILAGRVQGNNTRPSVRFNVLDLPESIKITQREHVADESTKESAKDNARNCQKIDEICAFLGHRGLTELQVGQCRELFVRLSAPEHDTKNELQGFPNATWQDVQSLLHSIFTRTTLPERRKTIKATEGDANLLISIFASLERNLKSKKAKETIKLLGSSLSDSANAGGNPAYAEKTAITGLSTKEKPGTDVSPATLQRFVDTYRLPSKFLANLQAIDRGVTFSIILQLLQTNDNKKLDDVCGRLLAAILASPLTAGEWSVLIAGIKHYSDINNYERFHKILLQVLFALRSLPYATSLEFLVDLWHRMPNTLHDILWPYAVNELLLVGMGGGKEHFYELTEIVCHMHPERMKNLRLRVEQFDIFRKKNVAPIIFRPAYVSSYPFFAFLFETSLGDVIADRVLVELQKDPQDAFAEAICPLLRLGHPRHLQLLKSYLTCAQNETLPLALKMEAGAIVLDYLKSITEEQKELAWLEKTIRAAAELRVDGTEDFLEQMVNERIYGVMPAWNKSCRKAATDALLLITGRQMRRP